MQHSDTITSLFNRYLDNEASTAEIRLLLEQFNAGDNEQLLREKIQQQLELPVEFDPAWQHRLDLAYRNIQDTMSSAPVVHRIHFLKTSWFRYAAAVILIIGGAAIWYTNTTRSYKSQESHKSTVQTVIAPGTNRAILTVGNSTINLSNNKTGIAVGNAITYNDGERIADAGQQLMLTTPRGGQYQATLPDGSKVWLNAASSIKFPSKFTSNTREVEVTGEAYLEVAQNAKQPFYVHTRKTTIQVLGTSFNINAYDNEDAERTTLIEGSVKVISNNEPSVRAGYAATTPEVNSGQAPRNAASVILKPKQQAIIDNHLIRLINGSDGSDAWRSGFFNMEGADLKQVMRQLERWYDITVKYEGKAPDITFRGDMDRGVNLAGVLRSFTELGIKTKLEGRTLIVLE